MELMKNLQWMCRVCAVNIKKRRSSSSVVSIFGTPQLMENLKKYLDIEISLGDGLPEIICGNCFKKLESFHNFATLAKKTENFLKDFIHMAQSNNAQTVEVFNNRFQTEFASFAIRGSDNEDVVYTKFPETNERGQMVLNFTLNNPLTKDIDAKIVKAREAIALRQYGSKHRQSTGNTYRSLSSDEDIMPMKNDNNMRMIENRLNLEQKRKNLKTILCNKNAQPTLQMTETPVTINQIFQPQQTHQQIVLNTTTNTISQENREIEQNIQKESVIYDCLNLGCVIKDMDLLKLILKALKWPYTNATFADTLQRLKDTRFRDVILDRNLLQDTDLMQILSTYLSPILLQSQNIPTVLPTVVSYKIPADTSVHLVSVQPDEVTEQNNQQKMQHHHHAIEQYQHLHHQQQQQRRQRLRNPPHLRKLKRLKYKPRPPPIIVNRNSPIEILSDDDSGEVQMFEVSIDPALYFPQDSENQENSNDRLQMINKQSNNKDGENAIKVRKKLKQKDVHIDNQVGKDSSKKCDIIMVEGKEQEIKINNIPIEKSSPIIQISNSKSNLNNKSSPIHKPNPNKKPSPKHNQDEVEKISEVQEEDSETITIDDDSNDDSVWADFKVIDSPEYIGTEEPASVIKPFVIKTEEINETNEKQEDILIENCDTDIVKMEKEEIKDEEVVEELTPVPHTPKPRGRPRRKRKVVVDTVEKAKEVNAQNDFTPENPTELRQSKRKTITTTEPVKAQETVKRRVGRPKSTSNKALERKSKTSSKYYVTPKQKVERNVKQRKRICKQCGFTFDNLIKFMEHRKKYHT